MARNALGLAMITAGRLAEGVDALVDSCTGFENPRIDRATLLATCELLAQAESARGRGAEAARWAGQAAGLADPDLPVFSGLVSLARAHAARTSDPEAAAAQADLAVAQLRAGQRRIDAGRALLTAGVAHDEAGHGDLARTRLREATGAFRACGARQLEARAARECRRLGVRVPVQGKDGNGPARYGLSPRELEIATLVARGLTNQKIAERLFLSVRTVETHLSRIFAKLGVGSRVGVATRLAREA
jgi:DNA-binding CsgD family transcriptional regulator